MSEADIVEQLASRSTPEPSIPREPIIQEPGEKVPQPETGLEPKDPKDPFAVAQNKAQLNQYFGVIPGSYQSMEAAAYIDNILSFASQEVGSDNIADIILYVRGVEQALGSKLTPNRVHKLNQFITIRNQARLVEQKREALLG